MQEHIAQYIVWNSNLVGSHAPFIVSSIVYNIESASSSRAASNPLLLNLIYFELIILNNKALEHVNEIAAFINEF